MLRSLSNGVTAFNTYKMVLKEQDYMEALLKLHSVRDSMHAHARMKFDQESLGRLADGPDPDWLQELCADRSMRPKQ